MGFFDDPYASAATRLLDPTCPSDVAGGTLLTRTWNNLTQSWRVYKTPAFADTDYGGVGKRIGVVKSAVFNWSAETNFLTNGTIFQGDPAATIAEMPHFVLNNGAGTSYRNRSSGTDRIWRKLHIGDQTDVATNPAGVYVDGGHRTRFEYCEIDHIHQPDGANNCGSIALDTADDCVVDQCLLHDNATTAPQPYNGNNVGVMGTDSQRATVTNNLIYNAGMGVNCKFPLGAGWTVLRNDIRDIPTGFAGGTGINFGGAGNTAVNSGHVVALNLLRNLHLGIGAYQNNGVNQGGTLSVYQNTIGSDVDWGIDVGGFNDQHIHSNANLASGSGGFYSLYVEAVGSTTNLLIECNYNGYFGIKTFRTAGTTFVGLPAWQLAVNSIVNAPDLNAKVISALATEFVTSGSGGTYALTPGSQLRGAGKAGGNIGYDWTNYGIDWSATSSGSSGGANVVPQTYLVPSLAGFRHTRSTDTTVPTAPLMGGTSDFAGSPPVADSSSVTINWINGQDPDSGIKDTQVEYSPSGQGQWIIHGLIAYNEGQGVADTIGSLGSNVSYDFRALNHNNAGLASAYSKIVTLTTLPSSTVSQPGTITLQANAFTLNENSQVSLSIVRTGAGSGGPAVDVTWQITGFPSGLIVPLNNTITFPAGQNGTIQITFGIGDVLADTAGTILLSAIVSETGNIQPSSGITSAALTIINQGNATVKKWNPGHYGLTQNLTFADDRKLAIQNIEQNEVIAQPNVQGLKALYLTGIFGNPGSFDFSKIFRDLNKLRTKNKHLAITLQGTIFGQGGYTDILPSNIYNNAAYGASPTSGKYGWWTINGGTGKIVAFWRPAVMTDFVIPLFNALAAAVNASTGITIDADPFVEQIAFVETSIGIDAGSDYTTAAMVTQYKRLIDAWKAAFQKTVCMCNNNGAGTQAATQDLTNYMLGQGIAEGGPDIYAIGQHGSGTYGGLTWGQKSVLGVVTGDANFTGPDLRGKIAMQSDLQGPELSSDARNGGRYTMYTPHSFFTVGDQILRQSHLFWSMVNVGSFTNPVPAYPADGVNTASVGTCGNWGSILQVINGNPLTHIAKPTSIP